MSTCRVEGFVWRVGTLQKKATWQSRAGSLRQPSARLLQAGVAACNSLHQGRACGSAVPVGAAVWTEGVRFISYPHLAANVGSLSGKALRAQQSSWVASS